MPLRISRFERHPGVVQAPNNTHNHINPPTHVSGSRKGHARAQTPQPVLSDVALRYCDKRLMEMQELVREQLERRASRRSQTPPPNKSVRQEDVVAVSDLVVTHEDQAHASGEPEGRRVHKEDDATLIVGHDSTAVATSRSCRHNIPTLGEHATPKKSVEKVAVVPVEVIAEHIPGASPALLDEAARRHKRAQRRRRDFINLQRSQQKPILNEHELFPDARNSAQDEGADQSDDNESVVADVLAPTRGNEGGVETPRCSNASDPHCPLLATTPQRFDFSPQRNHQQEETLGLNPPVYSSPFDHSCRRADDRPVKIYQMPETSEYQHIIRMKRTQQSQWKSMPYIWDASIAYRGATRDEHDYERLLSASLLDFQSGVDQLSDTRNFSEAHWSSVSAAGRPCAATQLALQHHHGEAQKKVPRLLIPLVAKGAPEESLPTPACPFVPKLNMLSIGGKRDECGNEPLQRADSPDNGPSRPSSSNASFPHRTRKMDGSARTDALETTASSDVGEVPLLNRRGGADVQSLTSMAISTQHTRSVAREGRHAHSSDDEDDENVDDLRQQFADFLKQTGNHHGDAGGGDGGGEDDERANVKPFVLPGTFVRYSLTNLRGMGHETSTLSQLRRRDSLIEDSDRSTSFFSKTVKIIWGSSTADAEPSSIARTAPCRLVVELLFRPGQHHFDAKHLYGLLQPFASYVLDIEAGNRGGKFLAIYSTSELQCLKAIASMMAKVRRGESYLLADCYCAPSPNQPHEMLLESPRDEDLEEEKLPHKQKQKLRKRSEEVTFIDLPDDSSGTNRSLVVCEEALIDDAEEEEEDMKDIDPMAWFKRHAAVIDTSTVNHHAPGAVQQFIAAVERRKRQKVQKSKRMSKKKSSIFARAAAVVAESIAAGSSDSFIPPPVAEEEAEDDKELKLFIAEGDEVDGLDGLVLEAEIEEEAEDVTFDATDNVRTMSMKKPQSIFSIKEMAEDAVQQALESNTCSIMELVARSKYSPEELRRMRSTVVAMKQSKLTKSQLHRMERMQQANMTSLKDYRESKSVDAVETSSNTSRKSSRRLQRRNAKALHAKRKKKMAEDAYNVRVALESPVVSAAEGDVTANNSNLEGAAADGIDIAAASHTSVGFIVDPPAEEAPSCLSPLTREADVFSSPSDSTAAVAATSQLAIMAESIVLSDSAVIVSSGMDGGPIDQQPTDPSPEAISRQQQQELDDAEALALFAEFLQQYATSEKVAVIVPMTKFEDPSLMPVPNAESDAEDLIFLLHQIDYDIVVMAPPMALARPGKDASREEIEEYEELVEYDRKRWFLTPTAENIAEVTECLLRQNQGGKYCCVALFLITRGFTGTLAQRVAPPYELGNQLIALTIDSDTLDLNAENTVNPRKLTHRMKKATGKVPMIFVDTYPLPEMPNSDAYGSYLNALVAPTPQVNSFGRLTSQAAHGGPPQRVPAPAFLSFTAQPEDGGNELLCHYPKYAGGLGSYYLKRALEGRACPPKSVVMTMSNMLWFLSTKLQKRGCKVQHNAVVPKGYSSLRQYFDLSTVYDSAYELQRNLAAAHVVEITSAVRMRVRCRVQLDQTMYVTEAESFLFAQEYWSRQLRRDLHKLLYPKKNELPPATQSKGPKSKQLVIKPRPEKALRLQCILCRCVPDTLTVQYPDCADLLFDEKRFRALERDIARISEKCDIIQQEEPHGFSFAHGLHLLSPNGGPQAASSVGQRPVDLVRGSKAQRNTVMEFDARRFSCQDLNLTLMKQYVRSRSSHESIPLALRPFLPSGFITLQFFGQRKRLQQDFAMNYFISGCQRSTIQGTTMVSLFKRPTMLWGEVNVEFVGNRRDQRKLDRLMRQQALRARGGDSIELLLVDLDVYESHEHIAAQSIQRIFRGHLVRRVLRRQREETTRERVGRNEAAEEERNSWYHTMLQFYGIYKRMLEVFEDRNRLDTYFEEQENRWYLIAEARRLLIAAYERGCQRIVTEEALDALPLLIEVGVLHLLAEESFHYAWMMAFHWYFHGVAWDRYYLEMDCFQEILRVRNVFRDETELDRYQLGYLMEHPTPPSTSLDSGRSIIRGIQEEKSRKDRKSAKERLKRAAEVARQRQREEDAEASHVGDHKETGEGGNNIPLDASVLPADTVTT